MALPSSGSLSFSQINVELGRSANAQLSMSDSGVRGLFGVASGQIGMNVGLGKSSAFNAVLVIATNTTNYNLRTAVIAAGWNQSLPVNVTCTINSGVTVYATSTGTYAFNTGTSFPAGSTINIINNGTILGAGGAGGSGGHQGSVTVGTSGANPGAAGSSGGPALYAAASVRITNNGRIAGGGGGGGGSGSGY